MTKKNYSGKKFLSIGNNGHGIISDFFIEFGQCFNKIPHHNKIFFETQFQNFLLK